MTHPDTYVDYIAGEWVASGDATMPNVNPANTREILGQVRLSNREAVNRAVAAAKAALPAWRRTPAASRARVIDRVRRIIEEQQEALARALTREEGKILREARGEVQRGLSVLEFMAGEGLRYWGYTSPSQLASNFCYTIRQPLGVVGMITPWNFPVCIPIWKIAPALVAGNTIVFKPSELTPWTATLVVKAFEDAGLPKGVLNMVIGTGPEVGDAIVRHPDIHALSFTGSTAVGHAVYAAGAAMHKKVQCEMGGKNPIVVLEDADIELAAAGAAQGAFGSTGQRCTATSRAIVIDRVADRFVDLVCAHAKKLVLGDGLDEKVDMGPSVEPKQFEKVLRYMEVGKQGGAECRVGGGERRDFPNGLFPEPTVFDHVTRTMRIAKEEIFGPVLAVIRVKDFDEAIAAANDVDFGLTSSLYTRDAAKWYRFVDEIETGITHLNSPTMGGEAQMPFGGMKATGIGAREVGPGAIEFYSEEKAVYVDYTGARREGNLY